MKNYIGRTQLLLPPTLNAAMSRSKIFQTANQGAVSQWKIVRLVADSFSFLTIVQQFFIGKRLPDSRFERSLNVTLPRSMSPAKVTEVVYCVIVVFKLNQVVYFVTKQEIRSRIQLYTRKSSWRLNTGRKWAEVSADDTALLSPESCGFHSQDIDGTQALQYRTRTGLG